MKMRSYERAGADTGKETGGTEYDGYSGTAGVFLPFSMMMMMVVAYYDWFGRGARRRRARLGPNWTWSENRRPQGHL